jgi:hypothetical protein
MIIDSTGKVLDVKELIKKAKDKGLVSKRRMK